MPGRIEKHKEYLKGLGARAVLDERVRVFHAASDGVYRAPRITADFRDSGTPVNVKTVAASLRRQGLEGVSPRGFRPVTTIPGVATHSIPDRVQRVWDTGRLNTVWISDITYLRTGEGWLYRCVVRDGCSRRVLGWAMDTHQDTNLVERALVMAKTLRGDFPGRVVFHADRGAQQAVKHLITKKLTTQLTRRALHRHNSSLIINNTHRHNQYPLISSHLHKLLDTLQLDNQLSA